jgi:hypothetical protein
MEMGDEEEQRRQRQKVVVGLQEQHGTKKKKTGAGAPTMSSAKYQTTRRAVKAVDEDLYVIPPDMLCHKPRVPTSTCTSPTLYTYSLIPGPEIRWIVETDKLLLCSTTTTLCLLTV